MKTTTIQLKEGQLQTVTPNELTLWRAETFWTKEPDTLAWIDTFNSDDLFVDIGANIGLYSLYAATKGVSVLAFEPESLNYALLNRNIHLNNLDQKIKAFALALSHETTLDTIHLSVFNEGDSCHHFKASPKNPAFHQGCVSFSLDHLVEQGFIPLPTHIKIDVDGCEHLIIDGAKNTLPKVQSVLIELNTHFPEHRNVNNVMQKLGFEIKEQTGALGNTLFYRT